MGLWVPLRPWHGPRVPAAHVPERWLDERALHFQAALSQEPSTADMLATVDFGSALFTKLWYTNALKNVGPLMQISMNSCRQPRSLAARQGSRFAPTGGVSQHAQNPINRASGGYGCMEDPFSQGWMQVPAGAWH